MKVKIRLDTLSQVHEFVRNIECLDAKIRICDNEGHCVNGKSVIGMMYALAEFEELWCTSDKDIYHAIYPFVVY